MFQKESREDLEARLRALDEEISAHPLASEPVKQAHQIVERHNENDKDAIAKDLAEHGLPSLDKLGKIQLEHTGSWWRLHRNRNKIVKKLDKLKA